MGPPEPLADTGPLLPIGTRTSITGIPYRKESRTLLPETRNLNAKTFVSS
jgi:hypothetical protein